MKKTWLVVGLGNPEGKYFNTYHNVGFVCCELLAGQFSAITAATAQNAKGKSNTFQKKGNQLIATYHLTPSVTTRLPLPTAHCPLPTNIDAACHLLKPLTYMNNSGQAVVAVARKHKIAPENIIVFTDDLYIDKGNIRVTAGGSSGGHNGLKSINELLGSNAYTKIRVGIKEDPAQSTKSISPANYVLSKIDAESRPRIDAACEQAVSAATMLLCGAPLAAVQNVYNKTNAAGGGN
jgi:PTH1 family peptidyl-tRNA hydrolase